MKALEKVDLLIERAIKEAEARKKEAYQIISEAMAGKSLKIESAESQNIMEKIRYYSNTDYLINQAIKILTPLKSRYTYYNEKDFKFIAIRVDENVEKIELFDILKTANTGLSGLDLSLSYRAINIYAHDDKE